MDWGDAAWGDYDNDGDLDILVAGNGEAYHKTKIYRNDNGDFSDINIDLLGVFGASVDWGDYDNDGDLDILLTGTYLEGFSMVNATKIFRNDTGVFSEDITNLFPGIGDGSAVWGDYDMDGYPDILMAGSHLTRIYHNNGDGTFSELFSDMRNVYFSTAAWADIDNDGDLDVFIAGASENGNVTLIYINDHGTFKESETYLPGMSDCSVAFGDYDQDGGMDLFICGTLVDYGPSLSKLYHNNYIQKNNVPDPPDFALAYNLGDYTVFSWNNASDPETPETGLTYNLRVGTTPGGSEIMSPMSSATGQRLVVDEGNVGHNHIWKIKGLENGQTYYWSVQAVDPGSRGSVFSEELSVRRFIAHSIRGEVFTNDETPVTKARVTAYLVNARGLALDYFSYYLDGSNAYNIFSFPEGEVIIGVYPDTTEYPGYLPTYYGDTDFYPAASRIHLDEDRTDINIMMIPKPLVLSGTVNVGGSLTMDQGKKSKTVTLTRGKAAEGSTAVGDVWVYLFNSAGEIISSDVTDSLGAFRFDSIPAGHYSFYADYMGHAMDAANDSLLLDQENHTYKIAAYVSDTTISYTVSDVTAVEDHIRVSGITVWPNPVQEALFVRFDRTDDREVTVRITGMDGSIRKSLHYGSVPAGAVMSIPVSDLPPGVYILSVDGQKTIYRTRIIKVR
jgi:hypothetical protein